MLGLCRCFSMISRINCQRALSGCSKLSKEQNFVRRHRSPVQVGQPLHETRPSLLKPGELTPGVTAAEYFERRIKLIRKLPSKSCAIIVGNQVKYASGAVFYPFQQNNDLFYLTGWNEPNSVMVLEKPTDSVEDMIFHMMVPPKESFTEQWEGFRTGVEGVKDIFNADEAVDVFQLASYLKNIMNRNEFIYLDIPDNNAKVTDASFFSDFFSMGRNPSKDTIHKVLNGLNSNQQIRGLSKIVAEMRKIKSPAELKIMRTAGKISGRAYNKAMATRVRNERTLQSLLEYNFVSGGCDKSAYIPVVATGSNALCIHYTRNDDVMYDDEMVLVDASGSLGGYCTDISRTWPVNGTFTSAQQDLYEAVLNVQKKSIALCKAVNQHSLNDIHEKSVQFMKEELRNLGFTNLPNNEVNKLYPHYVGHNLGLDVHDVPQVSRYEPLQVGQVITIEPGIYVPDDPAYPAHFRNIGVRIEDDIAIGQDTYTNLTVEAVKEIRDLENVMLNGVTTSIPSDVVAPLQQ